MTEKKDLVKKDGYFEDKKTGEIYVPAFKTLTDAVKSCYECDNVEITTAGELYSSRKALKSSDIYTDGTIVENKFRKIFKSYKVIFILYRKKDLTIKSIDIIINGDNPVDSVKGLLEEFLIMSNILM